MRTTNMNRALLAALCAAVAQQQAAAFQVVSKPMAASQRTTSTSLASSVQSGAQSSKSSSASSFTASVGTRAGGGQQPKQLDTSKPVKIQGGSLKTWALRSTAIERVMVTLGTDGRPLDVDLDLWHGPDNTPQKMRVYVEDGKQRTFKLVVETPRSPNTVAVRNIGQMEFPIDAYVQPNPQDNAYAMANAAGAEGLKNLDIIQGGAIKPYAFESYVDSVQVMIKTDGRPCNCRLELLQGPNNIKQLMEFYIEDGMDRPFYAIIDTPGSGNVIRIKNTSTVEFPMGALVAPYEMGDGRGEADMVLGGDGNDGFGQWDPQW